MMYYFLLLLLGLVPLLGALLFAKWNLRNPEKCRRLPRERIGGAVIGVICLVWSAWHGCQMLEGGLEKFQTIVWLLVPTSAVACWFWLDYLLARSLGGLLILTVNILLHEAFVHSMPCRWLFSAIAVCWGVLGMFLLGMPWRWRQLLEQAAANRRLAWGVAAVCAASTLIFWLLPALGVLRA
jgi:hypothetical protein